MPRILLAWELGGGLGHVGPLRAIAAELVRRSNIVSIATVPANAELCRQAFAQSNVEVLEVPTLPIAEKRLKIPCTYSDILHDSGYSSAEHVTRIVGEWLKLLDQYAPDLILADHSPSALLATNSRDFARATVGTGFLSPPDISPLPSLLPEIPKPHWAENVEKTVLESMNIAIATHGGQLLQRVAELLARVDRQYVLTFEELDQYGPWRNLKRSNSGYWIPFGTLPGQICDWPEVTSDSRTAQRVFVYLRDHSGETPLLKGLAYKKIPTICYSPRMSKSNMAEFSNSSVRVSSTPIDLRLIAKECSVAVLNGGHGTVCNFFRVGVPMLILPLTLEQRLTGQRLKELRIGDCIPNGNLNAIGSALERLLEDSSYKESFETIELRYSANTEETAISALVDDVEDLLPEENM